MRRRNLPIDQATAKRPTNDTDDGGDHIQPDWVATILHHWQDEAARRIAASFDRHASDDGTMRRIIDGSGMCVGAPDMDFAPMVAFNVNVLAIAKEMVSKFELLLSLASDAALLGSASLTEPARRELIEQRAHAATGTYLREIDRAFHQWHMWTIELALNTAACASDEIKRLQEPLGDEERLRLAAFRETKRAGRSRLRARAWLGPVIDASRIRAWLIEYGTDYLTRLADENIGVSAGAPAKTDNKRAFRAEHDEMVERLIATEHLTMSQAKARVKLVLMRRHGITSDRSYSRWKSGQES